MEASKIALGRKALWVACAYTSIQGCSGGASSEGSPDPSSSNDSGTALQNDASVSWDATDPIDARVPPDAPPVQVGSCANLKAKDVFENITPPTVNLGLTIPDPSTGSRAACGVMQVVADPVNQGTVYFTAERLGIHKSTDCGASWTKVSTGRNGALFDSGANWTFLLDPFTPTTLYASSFWGSLNGNQELRLFKSINSGVDWDPVWSNTLSAALQYNFVQDVGMDPIDSKHLAMSFHEDCKSPYTKVCIGESKDGGATWSVLNGPPQLTTWQEGAGVRILPDGSLVYTADNSFRSTDRGAHWTQLNHPIGSVYRQANGTYLGTGGNDGIFRSTDNIVWQSSGGMKGDFLLGDGARLFLTVRDPNPNRDAYFVASESDPSTWTLWAGAPKQATKYPFYIAGPEALSYDPGHHLLYSAGGPTGIWRVVTR